MAYAAKLPVNSTPNPANRTATARTFATLAASLMLSACAGGLGDSATSDLLAQSHQQGGPPQTASDPAAAPQSELEKATAYWGKEYGKNPRNLDAAIAYSKNLKAMGQKGQALSVMQQASMLHGNDRKLASEYGRLALEMDQLSVAAPLLEAADDPTAPDWKVISARGTVLAKQGKYKDAIPFYERAMTHAHDHPSISNNLAMAYAMSGEADKAEALLRKAAAADPSNAKVQQNLAIVLGLVGKHDEAKSMSSGSLYAEHNSSLMRKLVRNDIKPAAVPTVQTAKASATAISPVQNTMATATAGLKPANIPETAPVENAAARLADSYAAQGFKPSAR